VKELRSPNRVYDAAALAAARTYGGAYSYRD